MICIFCFYNISTGVQAKLAFDENFKHCNLITYDGEIWLVHEFDLFGIHTMNIKAHSLKSILRGIKVIPSLIATVAVCIDERAAVKWKPYIVRSCNEIDRYLSGVNVGFTFNPKHLYNKLLRRDGNGYEILSVWRR
jgi:hypothetical protein